MVKLGPDGEPLATGAKTAKAAPKRSQQPKDEDEFEEEERLATAFIKSARALKAMWGWTGVIDYLADELTNEEIEEVINRLDKLIHPAETCEGVTE